MKPRRLLASSLLALAAAGCQTRSRPLPVLSQMVPLLVGQSEIAVAVHSTDRPHPAFLVLHNDEKTAVEAGLAAIRARGGRLVEVRSQGERLVAFELDGRTWRFDPNRVFTANGAEATLRRHNDGSAPPHVLAEIRRFADAVLAVYEAPAVPFLVTLHNNTDGEYSAASYAPGGDLAASATAVHLPPGADPDDFFFVTDRRFYDALAAEGFPAVLQNNERVPDDGSLSVWAGRRGIPYVNVETEHGHRERQLRMLEALDGVLAWAEVTAK